jgi:hypothetical protein
VFIDDGVIPVTGFDLQISFTGPGIFEKVVIAQGDHDIFLPGLDGVPMFRGFV